MAFRKTLAHRFLHLARTHLRPNGPACKHPPEPDLAAMPILDRIRVLRPDRVRLDGLFPPPIPIPKPETETKPMISVAEVRKVLRVAQMEAARSRLREMRENCVSYPEFLRICSEASNTEQGSGIARSLDDSGAVVVLGNLVFLRPDQEIKTNVLGIHYAKAISGLQNKATIAKAIERTIPQPMPKQNDSCREELRELEAKKAVIDKEAEAGVKRELWCGLGFMVVQTMGFMRLTFWELSWDVMEPICFFVTSTYFMAGYGFFLRTAKEPSFEGFFQSRFDAKQKHLMKAYNFDLSRFNQLKQLKDGSKPFRDIAVAASSCDCCR